jgi:hypothetical protein
MPSTAAWKHCAATPSASATSPTTAGAHCCTAAHYTHSSTHSELRRAGLIASAASVLQFNGDWGFVVLWGSPTDRAKLVYPDFHGVMDIATNPKTNWGNTDLLPDFGMPSL